MNKLLALSIFFIPYSFGKTKTQLKKIEKNTKQVIHYYQFDENQKKLVSIAEPPKEEKNENTVITDQKNISFKKTEYKYTIDITKEITKEIVAEWTKYIPEKNQATILFCLHTTSGPHIDSIMIIVEEKIISLFTQSGFSRACMLKTVELHSEGDDFQNDSLQITIFFSDNTLDAAPSLLVDLDMKL